MAAQMGLKFLFSPLHWIVNPCWLKDIMVSFYEFVKFYKEHCHSFACGAFISKFHHYLQFTIHFKKFQLQLQLHELHCIPVVADISK